MPELPEVETVARQLNEAIRNNRIKSVQVIDPKLKNCNLDEAEGSRIQEVKRFGKQVVFALIPPRKRTAQLWLAVHLRMTGRLIYSEGYRPEEPSTNPRVVLSIDRGRVEFIDTRRFGTMLLTSSITDILPGGLEPLSKEFTWQRLAELLGDSATPLKNWLLRQDRVTGIGNVYASEICFKAGIHPARPAGGLTDEEVKQVHKVTRQILHAAIRHCGTTFSDFQDSRGQVGGYVKYLAVYNREDQPCKKCGNGIQRAVQAQRSTYFCPTCQSGDGL